MTPRENTVLVAEKRLALTETVTTIFKNIFFMLYFHWEIPFALRISQLSFCELITKNLSLVTYYSSILNYIQLTMQVSKTKIKPPEFFKGYNSQFAL